MPLFQACAPMTRPGSVARIVGVAKDLSIVRISWLCLCQKSTNKIGDRFHPLNQPPLILCKPFFVVVVQVDQPINLKHLGFSHHARRRSWKFSRMLRNDGSSRSNNGCTSIKHGAPRLARFARFFGHGPFFFHHGPTKIPSSCVCGGVLRSHF